MSKLMLLEEMLNKNFAFMQLFFHYLERDWKVTNIKQRRKNTEQTLTTNPYKRRIGTATRYAK